MEKKKVTRDRAMTIQHILRALEEVIAERGLEGVGVTVIAEKANVSKVLIYRYFGSIDNLLSYYIRTGYLFSRFTPDLLNQIRPMHQGDMAQIWSRQILQLFQEFRASKAARAVLKANMSDDPLASVVNHDLDIEFTNFVHTLSFVESEGAETEAISAILLGGLSYLTIMAQQNRSMIGIDLRSEAGWQRVEQATIQIYKALGQSLNTSFSTQSPRKSVNLPVHDW